MAQKFSSIHCVDTLTYEQVPRGSYFLLTADG